MKIRMALAGLLIAGLVSSASVQNVSAQNVSAQMEDGDTVIGPDYAPAPELTATPGMATGTVQEFTMLPSDSKIYPGIKRNPDYTPQRDALGNVNMVEGAAPAAVAWPYEPRHVWVYIPAGYKPGTPAPVIIAQDGNQHRQRLVKALDGMIAAKRIPAMVAVMIDPGNTPQGAAKTEDGQGSERGLEYDTVSGRYSDFIETEVLPQVARNYGITFTKDPDGRATMGGSSGAAAAFSMAWFHPERYHRVILYSPTFVNQQSPYNPETPHGAWEYHDHIIAQAPRKPIRVWMEVGENDNRATAPDESFHNWVTAARRTAAVLKAKGYHYRFVFAKGARHVDPHVVEQTLPEALEYAWSGYCAR